MFNNKKKSSNISQLDSAPISTVIGGDITFKGDVTGGNTIKIDGKVIGNIYVDNGLILGEKGIITGNIKSQNIIVYGTINGNIDCTELILKNTGNITGDINTENVEVEMGGKYNGLLNMNPSIKLSKKEHKEAQAV